MDERFKGFIAGRHTERLTDVRSGEAIRSEAQDYEGISEHGVELARERVQEIKRFVDDAPKRTVLFFGGSSEEQRTKSTIDVYGDTLAELYRGSDEVLVFSQKDINAIHNPQRGIAGTVHEVEKCIGQNPDKKVVITYPLFLEEFSLRPDFRTKEAPHSLTKYADTLQPGGAAEHEAVEALLRSTGSVTTPEGEEVRGPAALDVSKKYLAGIRRLREFAMKYAPDRPVTVGFVSHGLILDAFFAHLAHKGVPTVEAFEKTGGKMVQSSELAEVIVENGDVTFHYRGHSFDVPPAALEGA